MDKQLIKLIASGESGTVEFKRSFYLTGDVEKYGTGFIRIRKRLQGSYAGINLHLSSGSGVFRVSIGLLNAIKETAPQTAPQTTRDQIVQLLKENPQLTKQDMMDILQKVSGTIKEHVRILKKEGRIKRVGPDKGGYWDVLE